LQRLKVGAPIEKDREPEREREIDKVEENHSIIITLQVYVCILSIFFPVLKKYLNAK